MRVCCGLTAHLELARRPDLYGTPVIVGRWDEHVVAASEETSAFGVLHGMALRQAEHLCPQATFVLPDEEAVVRIRELIAAALYDLAPVVEVRDEGIAWLDLSGVTNPGQSIRAARHRLLRAIGREPRLGLAPGPFSRRPERDPAVCCESQTLGNSSPLFPPASCRSTRSNESGSTCSVCAPSARWRRSVRASSKASSVAMGGVRCFSRAAWNRISSMPGAHHSSRALTDSLENLSRTAKRSFSSRARCAAIWPTSSGSVGLGPST